jgi:hypothetical protein
MPEYRTPGVYIEEISSGPRPVQASSTTETGFVAVITIPTIFYPGRGKAAGMYLPGPAENDFSQSWNRALAFRPLLLESADAPAKGKKGDGGAAPAAGGNNFQKLVADILPGKWDIRPPSGADNKVTMSSDKGDLLRFPVSRALMSITTDDATNKVEWDLAFGADENKIVQLISAYASDAGIEHTGNLGAVDPKGKPVTLNIGNVHDRLHGTSPSFTSMDGFHAWRMEYGERLFIEILLEADAKMSQSKAEVIWDSMNGTAKAAWQNWLRSHPGLRRIELSVVGFFSNGGATAFPAVALQGADGSYPVAKRQFLEKAFDGASVVAMLAAPGLNIGWQQGILEYSGPAGRGDLFSILEAPRYLLTKPPRGVKVNQFRWITEENGNNPGDYEVVELQTLAEPVAAELRFGGFAADVVLDRCTPRDNSGYGACYSPWLIVDNPLATGLSDKYIIAPPSGFVAGVIAGTDTRAGGGVHKAPANEQVLGVAELVTSVSDREQASLNVKGINIIRHRPGAGIRIWGARTVASDALWNYVNVRRLFLFVERSVRDSVNWAVFQPNNDQTRGNLRDSIAGFLFRLYNMGMLDGASWGDAFSVHCDRENNPEADVRAGLLTVDVQIRPVFPAEFIRIRFQQTPMSIG